jgi:hypothetical protein
MTPTKLTILLALTFALTPARAQTSVGRYGIFESAFQASGTYANPYAAIRAEATFERPDHTTWRIPLFWDGENNWKVRISPDIVGEWNYGITSTDAGLNGRTGEFVCTESSRAGGIVASTRQPGHFERQNGAPFFFLGDTAWAYFTDIPEEKHDRAQAEAYLKARAGQGFTVIHSMLLSEGGDGNSGGPPWQSIAEEQINPAYFREAERRIAYANQQGVTVGIALAWGDKRKTERYPWRRMPNLEARRRYARYVAARFSAYDVYFLISGEWHGEIRTRGNMSAQQVFSEFVELGNEFAAAEPHHRMIGIHPMGSEGSSREFASTPWMSFGDYQQNYRHLHGKILTSRGFGRPVVNAEYGYFLRDQNGDGKPDKDNSYSADDMRFASWDIAMAGGYLVTGFGTTYFGGHRDPGNFDWAAPKNRIWEQQIGALKRFLEAAEFRRLIPADELISSETPRGDDIYTGALGQRGRELHPPKVTYWALTDPGRTYVAYVRGITAPVRLELGARANHFHVREFNPRTGEFRQLPDVEIRDSWQFTPQSAEDWVMLLEAVP